MIKEKLIITGMTCAVCQNTVTKAINSVKGVVKADVNLLSGVAYVEFDETKTKIDDIVKAVVDSGYGVKQDKVNTQKSSSWETIKQEKIKESKQLRNRLIWSLVFLLPLMYISMGSMIGLPIPTFLKGVNNAGVFALIQLVLTIPVIVINYQFFNKGVKALLKKSPNMDTLISIGSGASFIYGMVVTFLIVYYLGNGNTMQVHSLMHSLYFESSAMILTLVTLGKYFESLSKLKTTSAIDGLVSLTPKTALRLNGDVEEIIETKDIRVGDVIIVKTGDVVPIDGTILKGDGLFDLSSITGESMPVQLDYNKQIMSGSICKNGFVHIKAQKVGEDTTLNEIIKLVDEAGNSKAPISRLADKVSGVFVPVVMGIALITFIVWLCLGYNIGYALSNMVAVLVISCPCALGLATPVAIMVGSGKMFKLGILVKSAETLENLHKVDTVVLDKTGTITTGKFAVTDVKVLDNNIDEKEFLNIVANIESKSNHSIAQAICEYAKKTTELDIKDYKEVSGKGISCKVKSDSYTIGNLKMFEKSAIDANNEAVITYNQLVKLGKTTVLVKKNDLFIGVIAIADTIREDSKTAISLLKAMGIKTIMLSGDNNATATMVGNLVGVDQIISDVLPKDKEKYIRQLQEQGNMVAMVGDGINDSPALTRANVGVAIGSGTDIAGLSADLILASNSLMSLVSGVQLGKATIVDIKENLFWAFFYNTIGIPLATGMFSHILGWTLNPMIASLAMSLSSVCVVLNALRLNLFKPKLDINKINQVKSKGVKTMTKVINIEGMMCGHCVGHVNDALTHVKGVETCEVSLENKNAIVSLNKNVSDKTLKNAVEKAGYKVVSIETK